MTSPSCASIRPLSQRFRGFFPVVVDIETGGFDFEKDGILELAAMTIKQDATGRWIIDTGQFYPIEPFKGAHLDPKALAFTGIDPFHPFRKAQPEKQALNQFFSFVHERQQYFNCTRCVLVGHNAWFDLNFLKAAIRRNRIKKSPFHPFTTFDTASLSALTLGHTVLSKSCELAQIAFDDTQAHSAIYDAHKTAELFCTILNRWDQLSHQDTN